MKKNKKLALQISAIVTLLFIVTITLIGYIVVTKTKKMYLESNNRDILKEVNEYKDLFVNPEIVGTMLDYWQAHPEEISGPRSPEAESILSEIKYSTDNARLTDKATLEWMDPAIRTAFFKAVYDYNTSFFQAKCNKGEFVEMNCLALRKDDERNDQSEDDLCLLFYCNEESGETDMHGLGEYLSMQDDYSVFRTLLNGKYGVDYGDLVCQELKSDDLNKLYYLAAAPVVADGELQYVLVFAYDWSSFAEILNVNLHSIILWGGIGLVVTNVLLILFIYFRAVRPTVKVNDGVREYMKTKDSAAIAEKMNAIGQKNEIGRLADSISELAREIDRYTSDIARLTGEKERVEAELNLAAKIQLSALPATFPAFPEHDEFDLYASMTPAKNVGGDFYDFFFLDETHLGLVIADVSDKGVPAALFMMMAKILIKSCAMTEPSPAAVLARTNKNLCENNRNKMFVTVWFGVLDITTGHVTAANAGHEYPMIRKNGGGFEILKDSHDFVVGLRKNKEYHDYEFDLAPGDTLFLYTDGAAEAADSALQQFGTERMLAALNEAPDAGPEQLLGNMKAAIDRFVGDAPQFDDLTMLAIKIQKTGRKTP